MNIVAMSSKINKVIIFGKGHIADIAHYYLEHDSDYQIAGFTVDKEYCDNNEHNGLPLVPFDEIKNFYPPLEYAMFIPISFKQMNKIRQQRYNDAKKKGYECISYISSKAICNAKSVGDNCFILELNNIQPEVIIGNNVILWSGNHIGHHSVVKDNCFFSSHVVVGGATVINENSFFGMNVTIRDNITIGKEVVLGAGATILKDIPDFSVVSSETSEISKVPSHRLKI